MRIGILNRRVEYQEQTELQNALGQPVKGWATRATWWAQVRSLRGAEHLLAQQFRETVSRVVVVRWPGYRPDPKAQLLYGSAVLSILWVDDVKERHWFLNLYCTEVMAPAPAP